MRRRCGAAAALLLLLAAARAADAAWSPLSLITGARSKHLDKQGTADKGDVCTNTSARGGGARGGLRGGAAARRGSGARVSSAAHARARARWQ